jgi:hypothetical protein
MTCGEEGSQEHAVSPEENVSRGKEWLLDHMLWGQYDEAWELASSYWV